MIRPRHLAWILPAVAALALLASAAAGRKPAAPASGKRAPDPFPSVFAGERLDYDFGWNGLAAAEVSVRNEVEDCAGRPCYHIHIDLSTKPQIDWIWKMRDRIDTYAEIGTLRPLRYSFRQREANFKHDTEVVYDQVQHLATSTTRYKDQVKVKTVPCQGVYDPITALLRMRLSDAKPGDTEELQVFDGVRVHTIRYEVVGIEEVATEFGDIRARKVRPWIEKSDPPVRKTDDSKTAKVRTVYGWIGLPGDPLLYRIESAATVGKIYAELMDKQAAP